MAIASSAIFITWSIAADGPTEIFEHAFGLKPPSAVTNLRVRREYAGGPGDRMTWIVFSADESAIDSIIASRKLELQPDALADQSKSVVLSDLEKAFGKSDFQGFAGLGIEPGVQNRLTRRVYRRTSLRDRQIPLQTILYWNGLNAWATFSEG